MYSKNTISKYARLLPDILSNDNLFKQLEVSISFRIFEIVQITLFML